MSSLHHGWWRRALSAGATIAVLMGVGGCGHSTSGPASGPASGSASGPATPCTPLPASDVPPIKKALTERDHGTYCATPGTTILVVLKAPDLKPGDGWAQPTVDGPAGGAHAVAPPLTPLRGTTVAAVELSAPGNYTFSSSAASATWRAVVEVSAGH